MAEILDGKVAIVTGAGGGLGRAEAVELARLGADVVVNDLGVSVEGKGPGRSVAADEVVSLITSAGGTAIANYADVSDWSNCAALVSQAVDEFGRLDILVNTAGNIRKGPITDLAERDFDDQFRVHVKSTAALTHHAGRYWRDRRAAGHPVEAAIVNTSSRAGLNPRMPGIAWYGAAKGAVAALTLSTSLEYRDLGVRVNAIAPHSVTRQDAFNAGVDYDPSKPHPFSPERVATAVAWLASPYAKGVNGKVIWVEGDDLAVMAPWETTGLVTRGGGWKLDQIARALGLDNELAEAGRQ